MMEVTPHLKTVLKNYQHSATKSLQGPGVALVAPKTEAPSPDPKEDGEFFQPPPFPPVQQLPILTTADTSCSERTETALEGETISCFVVGGEKRLCLPQILNSVLRDFSLNQINQECDRLQIYCSRCTPEQLNVLKSQGILPCSAPSCGLITKTDAERLCSALLHPQSPPQPLRPRKGAFTFTVYHRCFGKCRGMCYPDLYTSRDSRCVECVDCNGSFTPQQFVCHVHRNLENRTVHWGFDSSNWRAYLLVPEEQEERERCLRCLDEMAGRYEGKVSFPPPLPNVKNNLKRKEISVDNDIVKEEHDINATMVKEDPDPPPFKKNKIEEYFSHLPYNIQLQQIYAAVDPLYFQIMHDLTAANSNRHHLSAFKPVPHCLKETRLRQLGRYGDTPVLQNPERVVPLSESERFERSFQPNVALAPPLLKHRYICRDRKDEVTSSSRETTIKSPVVIKQEKITEEPHSTVSVVRYNSEIELSTDTDDSASETAEKSSNGTSSDLCKIEEALKPVDDKVRSRVLELLRNIAKEHEAVMREKDNKICELQARIVELEGGRKEGEVVVNGDEGCSSSPQQQQTSVIASVEQKAIVLTAE